MELWKAEMLALAARITELRGPTPKLPFTQALKIDRPTLIKVEQGKIPVPQAMAEAIDAYCETGGEIERRRRRVEALRAGWPIPAEEVSPTNRRTLISGSVGLFATAGTAAAISDRIAESAVSPRALREIERDVQRIATVYPTTPAAVLVPRVEEGWIDTERLLDARVRGRTRTTLDTRAGQYALYLALTANDLGHHSAADTYLDLAGQHADEAGDRLLADCVAILDSSFAFFRNQPHRAQSVAAERRPDAHPYARPMLAVCESRAAARAGEPAAARRALDDVWAHLWTGQPLPGTVPVSEDLARAQTAAILSTLADPAAEEHARSAIAVYTETKQAGMLGGSYNALARSYLRRPEPEPESAAAAARSALAAVGDQRTSWVVDVSAQMWRQMNAQWPAVDGVQALGELVGVAERRAIPPADL